MTDQNIPDNVREFIEFCKETSGRNWLEPGVLSPSFEDISKALELEPQKVLDKFVNFQHYQWTTEQVLARKDYAADLVCWYYERHGKLKR
tara:strand:- start:1125 stop:1394 length:270 start_codon:yes stop_codon:yes gene_type:complete